MTSIVSVASTATAKRITRAEMQNVPKIPSLPISYREAEKILRNMGGQRVPDDWQGGLPFAYHLGAGPTRVHLTIQSDWSLKPVYDVIATLTTQAEAEGLAQCILGFPHECGADMQCLSHIAMQCVDPNVSVKIEMVNQAKGYAQARLNRAQGEANRFVATLKEYNQAKDIISKRLYIETMEEILPNIDKVIIVVIFLSLLPLIIKFIREKMKS